MANRFSVEAVFKAVDRMSAPVTRMQNRIRRFTRSANRGLDKMAKKLRRMGGGLRRMAVGAGVAFAAAGAVMADTIRTGARFEQSVVTAAVKFPGEIRKGSKAYKELSDAAKEVGRSTEFTASQSAEALNFLAMAGFDAKTAIGALPQVVDLATVGALDLGRATDIATDSMGAFNLLSDDAATNTANLARVSDIMAATSTSANTTIEDMFEALKQGAPVATAAGQSIETTAALIATMANAGIKGTKAGTGLKNIMLAIGAPGSQAARIFRRLGVDVADSEGNIRDAVDVFDDFGVAVQKLPESQKLQAFREIFGKIPIAAAINLSNAADKTREFRDELKDVQGVTKKMADVMRDTTEGNVKALISAVEAVKVRAFEIAGADFNNFIEAATAWTRLNEEGLAQNLGTGIQNTIELFTTMAFWVKEIGVEIDMWAERLEGISGPGSFLGGVFGVVQSIVAPGMAGQIAANEAAEAEESARRSSRGSRFAAGLAGAAERGEVEITIKDETGRAEVTKKPHGSLHNAIRSLNLQTSGGF